MFEFIRGTLAEKNINYAVVDVGGIGFKIYTSTTSLADASLNVGADAVFYTFMYIKEGIMDLYGFTTRDELELFKLLISVSGIGAKGAVAVLSVASIQQLSLSIVTGDASLIKKASGIGEKTAKRICLELKDKIKNENFVSDKTDAFDTSIPVVMNDAHSEAISALVALGYQMGEAQKAVSAVGGGYDKTEDVLKQALKNLM